MHARASAAACRARVYANLLMFCGGGRRRGEGGRTGTTGVLAGVGHVPGNGPLLAGLGCGDYMPALRLHTLPAPRSKPSSGHSVDTPRSNVDEP